MNQTEVLWYEDLERSTGRSTSVRRSDNRQVKRARSAKKARKARRRRRIRGMCMLFLLAIMLVCVLKGTFLSKRVILRASGCPESLIELAERQPEAYNLAKDYKKYANKDITSTIEDFKTQRETKCNNTTTEDGSVCSGRVIDEGWVMNY